MGDWTPERDRTLRELWGRLRMRDIADKCGQTHKACVGRRARQLGLPKLERTYGGGRPREFDRPERPVRPELRRKRHNLSPEGLALYVRELRPRHALGVVGERVWYASCDAAFYAAMCAALEHGEGA